jgi:hypothetical protein
MDNMGNASRPEATSTLCSQPSKYTMNVVPNDILIGRGMSGSCHPGNIFFRGLIEERRARYTSSSRRNIKKKIAEEIVAIVKQSKGRFLRPIMSPDEATELGITMEAKAWIIVNEAAIKQRIKQKLRNEIAPICEIVSETVSLETTQPPVQLNDDALASHFHVVGSSQINSPLERNNSTISGLLSHINGNTVHHNVLPEYVPPQRLPDIPRNLNLQPDRQIEQSTSSSSSVPYSDPISASLSVAIISRLMRGTDLQTTPVTPPTHDTSGNNTSNENLRYLLQQKLFSNNTSLHHLSPQHGMSKLLDQFASSFPNLNGSVNVPNMTDIIVDICRRNLSHSRLRSPISISEPMDQYDLPILPTYSAQNLLQNHFGQILSSNSVYDTGSMSPIVDQNGVVSHTENSQLIRTLSFIVESLGITEPNTFNLFIKLLELDQRS